MLKYIQNWFKTNILRQSVSLARQALKVHYVNQKNYIDPYENSLAYTVQKRGQVPTALLDHEPSFVFQGLIYPIITIACNPTKKQVGGIKRSWFVKQAKTKAIQSLDSQEDIELLKILDTTKNINSLCIENLENFISCLYKKTHVDKILLQENTWLHIKEYFPKRITLKNNKYYFDNIKVCFSENIPNNVIYLIDTPDNLGNFFIINDTIMWNADDPRRLRFGCVFYKNINISVNNPDLFCNKIVLVNNNMNEANLDNIDYVTSDKYTEDLINKLKLAKKEHVLKIKSDNGEISVYLKCGNSGKYALKINHIIHLLDSKLKYNLGILDIPYSLNEKKQEPGKIDYPEI